VTVRVATRAVPASNLLALLHTTVIAILGRGTLASPAAHAIVDEAAWRLHMQHGEDQE
jgi:hypothetical protein